MSRWCFIRTPPLELAELAETPEEPGPRQDALGWALGKFSKHIQVEASGLADCGEGSLNGDREGDPGGVAATGRISSILLDLVSPGVCGIGVAMGAEAERKPRQEAGEPHSCLKTSAALLTPLTSPAPLPAPPQQGFFRGHAKLEQYCQYVTF